MIYTLLKDGIAINTIVASEKFVASYAESMGYTYELVPEPEPHAPDPEPEPAPEEAVTWASMATSIKEGVDDV